MATCADLVNATNSIVSKLDEIKAIFQAQAGDVALIRLYLLDIQKHLGARLPHRNFWLEISEKLLEIIKYSGEINAERLAQGLQESLGFSTAPDSNAVAPNDLDKTTDIDTPGV